jgi:hypothetical protein
LLRVAAQAARQSDLAVVRLPWPFPDPGEVLPDTMPGDLAVYSGPIPQHPKHYASLERELIARAARLVNTASASEQATRIEHWHHRLGELTARTVILRGPSDLAAAAELGFPLFLKGLVKSAKEHGLEACIARDTEALAARARAAWAREQSLVAREYLPLRQTGVTAMGFPRARVPLHPARPSDPRQRLLLGGHRPIRILRRHGPAAGRAGAQHIRSSGRAAAGR